MPWIEMPGVTGRVYAPDADARPKKHPCPDCFDCRWCSDARCEQCRKPQGCCRARNNNKK
jgi:hypothetical protein